MNAMIIWFSKKYNTVESSMFGSGFLAVGISRYLIVALHYKLRILGVPLDGSSDVMCENQVMFNKKTLPQSTLGKKNNALNCHVVCKEAASGILRVGKE